MARDNDSPFGPDGLVAPSPIPSQPNPAGPGSPPPPVPTPAWTPSPEFPQPPTYSSPPAQIRRTRGDWRKKAGGAAGGVGVLAKILVSVKGLAVVLHFKTLFSMLASVVVYTLFWGWKFALGFVLLMFVHEMGHVVVLRAQGVRASAPMFIPLLGAFVNVKSAQRSVAAEATSALAGPAAGILAAGAVMAYADWMQSPFLRALAFTGFLLNLFNLLPALPLDGGRVAGALHPAVWFIGLAGAVAFFFYHPSPILILIVILGGGETIRRWRQRRAGNAGEYYSVPKARRVQIAVAYVLVAALCLAGMAATYAPAAHTWR